MAIVYSNIITITVSGISTTYTINLDFSNTSFNSSGGNTIATATLKANTPNANLSGFTIYLNQISSPNTNAPIINSWSAITDSNGIATFNVNIPANTSTSTQNYYFVATVNI